MIDFFSKLDEVDKIRIKITFFLILISSIIVFMLSFSIYLIYENQKFVEIEDKLKSKLFEILPSLDDDFKKVLQTNLEEGTFLCVYIFETEKKLCINNLNGISYNFSNFNKTNLDTAVGTKVIGSFYQISYFHKSSKEYYIVIGQNIDKVKEDLKKLRNSIILSSIAVILLSGFLAFSVSGRLLEPIKQQKNNLENTLSIISHDLKTPISVINTNLYIMKQKNFQNIENNLKQIEKNLDYIKSIVSNVDALREISAEELEDINVPNLIEDILKKFELKIKEKQITYQIQKEEDLIVKAKKIDMDVCFTNLIDNAIKYNVKNGQIIIKVSRDKISISNTGKPIKDIKKIFEKFYREDISGTTEGLGLGLSIVKNICRKYGWKIKAEIQDNLNTFIIELS
ncbi:sensor histidine kinase [Sulfurihydrogenibium subterraneum]|uniref:sensor histidine kinase n=1 Tax=Sulfurihydrogenibium subterraneum TaxID=171121 RepID=UPI000491760D|nr:HAMP domain-containing sensor histidine kinase [Sulfurihydrogenibium subterraneum]